MKNRKHCTVFGFFAIITLIFAFMACDNNDPKTFLVTFDADNGSQTTTQTVDEGNKAIKPTNPVKNGFNFDYWFNVATNNEWDFNTSITANVSLKAKWIPEQPVDRTYTITLKDGDLEFIVKYIALPNVMDFPRFIGQGVKPQC